jgi:hypothetical protein
MPVIVACRCGQRFAAQDHLFGRQVNCPACGGPLVIPSPQQQPIASPLQPAVPSTLQARPGPTRAQYQQQGSAAGPSNQLMLIGLVLGGSALLLVIAAVVLAIAFSSPPQVAQGPNPAGEPSAPTLAGPATPPAPPAVPPSPAAPAPVPTLPPPAPAEIPRSQQSPTSVRPAGSAFQEATIAGGQRITFLPPAVNSWHTDGTGLRRGVVRVGDAETLYAHFSWMTQLLPFLGHQKEYNRINFREELLTENNLEVGTEVIPAFLNPLDDRQVWKGHPFGGLALTHFAGMSGIEDTRNVVAAALPRDDPRAGVFGYDEVARPDEITDGTSQTIMVVGSGALANPWIMGGGGTIRGARPPYFDKVSGLGTRNLPQPGTIAVMADGSVRFISANVDPQAFRAMCTIHGRDSVDLEQASQPFLLESIEN